MIHHRLLHSYILSSLQKKCYGNSIFKMKMNTHVYYFNDAVHVVFVAGFIKYKSGTRKCHKVSEKLTSTDIFPQNEKSASGSSQ